MFIDASVEEGFVGIFWLPPIKYPTPPPTKSATVIELNTILFIGVFNAQMNNTPGNRQQKKGG